MKRNTGLILAMMVLVSCAGYPSPSMATDQPNLMIMGEDGNPSSISRSSQVFRRVINGLSNELGDAGYRVLDETAITLDNFSQDRNRRSDAELFDILRSIKRPPIDVGVLFAIFPDIEEKNYTTRINVRVEGRLVHVRTGERLGNFEVALPTQNAPADCNRVCLRSQVGQVSKVLGQELGAILTEKLDAIAGTFNASNRAGNVPGLPGAYTLIFNGFDSEEIYSIEEFITAFKGYKSHELNEKSSRNYEYEYKTSSKRMRLDRNLRRMLDHLALRGRITYGRGIFKVEKITLRSN